MNINHVNVPMRMMRQRRVFRQAAATLAVAGLLLSQLAVVGRTIGAALAGAESDILRFVCANGKVGEDQKAPADRHHMGACCILHGEGTIEPDATPASAIALALSPPTLVAPLAARTDANREAPEMAPRSARAPPRERA